MQAFAAAAGGAQSIHTNGFDEALALPTPASATLALRTQQVLMHESGLTDTADPMGGSFYIESLTDRMITAARTLIDELEAQGGAVDAAASGWTKQQIEESAWRHHEQVERGERVIVGVTDFQSTDHDDESAIEILRIDPKDEATQVARLAAWRAERDSHACTEALSRVEAVAAGTDNIVPVLRDALKRGCTIGEACNVLRATWGEYDRMSTVRS